MVQWQDPTVQARLGVANMDITFLLVGLYGWEYFQSLDVEYAVIRGRLSFRWPLIPYLVGRFFLFNFLLLSAARTAPSSILLCLPGIMATTIMGNVTMATCSTNLMIRTWVIWKNSRLVHIVLLVLAFGHCVILAFDVANIKQSEVDGQCIIGVVHPEANAGVFVYTVGYDFLVLLLTIIGLSKQTSKSPLMKRLRAQGLVYFAVTVIAYIPPTVFSFLGVDMMVSLTGISAITASTICACRVVRSLLGFRRPGSSQLTESAESDVALTTGVPVQTMTSTITAC